ncbi:leucine-rich repeat receptor protein kinase HPCA1-like isoform X1 [Typha latifolia]|uniref:leucine-rich repeat receptor protein kinase HPCA1-like isoform X1 n=1 Tax=Typha latifolia TaxID=4733 RepID=UPI003C2F4618
MVIVTKLLLLLLLFVCLDSMQLASGVTHQQDVDSLNFLKSQWRNLPPNWRKRGSDPCDTPWEGVLCKNSRVTELNLFNMNLQGELSSYIGNLTQLQSLDLSSNKQLKGPLTPAIGNLTELKYLFLVNCSFSGRIPDELGNLTQLEYLSLNSNQFTGRIPASLGKLSNLFWLDLADNHLSGNIPISTSEPWGLDRLVNANHFHLNQNNLSGSIPGNFFHVGMSVKHVLLDSNQLSGNIPQTVGLVQNLEILRLDNNKLNGTVPSNISDLMHLSVLNISNNNLTGQMPNLTGMTNLNSVDLSKNLFDPSEAPGWLSTLQNLTNLALESANLHGNVPKELFSLPELEEVILMNNSFNGTLDMGDKISEKLETVNLQNNALESVVLSSNYNRTLKLAGNRICNNPQLSYTTYCQVQQGPTNNTSDLKNCFNPYEGYMMFRAPSISNINNHIAELRESVSPKLNCFPNRLDIRINNFNFDPYGYLHVLLTVCSPDGKSFNRSEVLRCFNLSSQDYQPPPIFGPYYFAPLPYNFDGDPVSHRGLIIGLSVGCTLLILAVLVVGIYASRQRERARRAISINDPFASWLSEGEDQGAAPQLNSAKSFSFDELRKSTNGFQRINEIGIGGYGKVYRGMLSDGRIVAIKRSNQGSTQGGLEFKTEIELLSRVHHKNLVGLVGFCFEKGERMLVYEFISNGTLRESLSGKSGRQLGWNRRLKIALDSAKGLAYLHEHANPPIIHRDIKSTNILLDENLTAKVADFGISQLVADTEIGYATTNVKGTVGYLDPEYYTTQQLTGKSDVYSFGVVMLELITGRPPLHNKVYVVQEVRMALDKKEREYCGLKEIIDPLIRTAENLGGFERFLELALQCVEFSAASRPTMSEVVKEIEMILQNNGVKSGSTTASSSARELIGLNAAARYSYDDSSPLTRGINSSAFDYSGDFVSRSHSSLNST